jgi:hypothetical protein
MTVPRAVHLGLACHPACPPGRIDARSRRNRLTEVSSSRRWRDVVTMASDPTVTSRASIARLLRTEPQVRLTNMFSYRTIIGTSPLPRTQALPLGFTRFLCPRHSRGGDAACPRDNNDLCPRTRTVHVPDPATDRSRSRTVHVREQSLPSFSPRPQTCPRTGRVLVQAMAWTVHGQASAKDGNCPWTVHGLERSTSRIWPGPRCVRDPRLSRKCPPRTLVVSLSRAIYFPTHAHIIPTYALI